MEIVVNGPAGSPNIWDHFLMKNTEATLESVDRIGRSATTKMFKLGTGFRWDRAEDFVKVDLILQTIFVLNGKSYRLLKIVQRFDVSDAGLQPTTWFKMSPDQEKGLPKGAPPLHPLLTVNASTVTLNIAFLDITNLFTDLHGDTPWFRALEILHGTPRSIRVLASLRGHPFVWYVVIPSSTQDNQELQCNVLYLPADYGGISYVADKLEGITTPNHDTSVGNIQCGGETLFSFLTNPVSDATYQDKLEQYLAMLKRFEKRQGRNPPALHHFREVLAYVASAGTLVPRYWDIPFGFEQALYDRKQVLFIPQINGAQGGVAIQQGLKALLQNAVSLIYTQGNTFVYETPVVLKQLILTCYSQSGGNTFTAANKNLADVRALICFEAQYMNQALSSEDKSLVLGKQVIPLLLRQSGKVAILGRRKQNFEAKYLPERVDVRDLILLPDDAHYSLFEYPPKAFGPDVSPVLRRRYSRLLGKVSDDPVISALLSQETGVIDFAGAADEAKVDETISKFRKQGFDDEKIVKAVFTASYNVDDSGGYFSHNFAVSSGQEVQSEDRPLLRFFNQALGLIG
jgi:hypothetical protein